MISREWFYQMLLELNIRWGYSDNSTRCENYPAEARGMKVSSSEFRRTHQKIQPSDLVLRWRVVSRIFSVARLYKRRYSERESSLNIDSRFDSSRSLDVAALNDAPLSSNLWRCA